MLKLTGAFLMASILPFSQCQGPNDGQVCTEVFVYGVNAEVTNAQTGALIADATLTLRDGSYVEVLQGFPTGGYVGAGERAGTYTLTAQATGFQDFTVENIVVKSDPCHVIPVSVKVPMTPQ